jgi:hypothetical protein
MALKMRATGLSSPVDQHLTDFTVLTAEWVIGRIYEVRGSPPDLRWFWAPHLNGSAQIASPRSKKSRTSSRPAGKRGSFGQTWRSGIRRNT